MFFDLTLSILGAMTRAVKQIDLEVAMKEG
jgi:hypothetical protein